MWGAATLPAHKWQQLRSGKHDVGSKALPDLPATQRSHTAKSPAVSARWPGNAVDGGARQLPQLSQTATSWSAPSFRKSSGAASTPVIIRGAGGSPMALEAVEMSKFILPYPLPHRAPSRAMTANPEMVENGTAGSKSRWRDDRLPHTGGPRKQTGQSPNVWHRWGVSVPSNRDQRAETLRKDREQQRQACCASAGRNLASPARSHAAASFFARGGGEVEYLNNFPLGAFRRAARPQTRQMECMPNSASKAVSSYGLSAVSMSSLLPLNKSGALSGSLKDHAPMSDINLPMEGDVFWSEEVDVLKTVLENYAALTCPLEDKNFESTGNSIATDRSIVRAPTGLARVVPEKDPLILRCSFCRLLLASGLCSTEGYSYHKNIALFDKHAISLGAFTAMPRSKVLRIFASMLQTREQEDASLSAMKISSPSHMTTFSDHDSRPSRIAHLADIAMPAAELHCKTRQKRVRMRAAQASPLELLDVPECILEELGDSEIWPPLPPRSVTESELPDYMKGVKEWKENFHSQSPDRLIALRAHTASVLHGEVLASQLLEPEVLHFVERFLPLFRELFLAYADFHVPGDCVSQGWQAKKGIAITGQLRCERRTIPNHVSLSAFFQFCVDLDFFPKHASLQEIQHIYNTADAVDRLPDAARAMYNKDSPRAPRSRTSSKTRPSSSATHEGPKYSKAQITAQIKIKKAAEAAAAAAVVAAAAAEAAVPKANLAVFDKPLEDMSEIEMRSMAFLAAIQEWLTERFLRLYDVLREVPSLASHPDLTVFSRRNSSVAETSCAGDEGGSPSHASDSGPRRRRGSSGGVSATKETSSLNAAIEAASRAAVAAIPKMIMVSANHLLEGISPMAMINTPSEIEIEDMFTLVLRDENSDEFITHHEIALFQLDKLCRLAYEKMEQHRHEACLLMHPKQSLAESACSELLTGILDCILQESRMGMSPSSVLDTIEEITPQGLLDIAAEMGVKTKSEPPKQILGRLFADLGANSSGALTKAQLYRGLMLVVRRRRQIQSAERRAQLSFLAGSGVEPPREQLFGLAAFVECLLKIAFHRLGGKGGNEIQRGAPSWWKCAWLLSLLGGKFVDRVRVLETEEHIECVAKGAFERSGSFALPEDTSRASSPVQPARKTTPQEKDRKKLPVQMDSFSNLTAPLVRTTSKKMQTFRTELSHQRSVALDTWWSSIYMADLPKFIPTLEHLALRLPRLFDPSNAESSAGSVGDARSQHLAPVCQLCGERRSPSGWGSPGCTDCGCVDTACMPIEKHLFAQLLFTEQPTQGDLTTWEGDESAHDLEL